MTNRPAHRSNTVTVNIWFYRLLLVVLVINGIPSLLQILGGGS